MVVGYQWKFQGLENYLCTVKRSIFRTFSLSFSFSFSIEQQSVDTTSWIKQGKVGRLPIDDVTHEMVSVPRVTSDVVKQVSVNKKAYLIADILK